MTIIDIRRARHAVTRPEAPTVPAATVIVPTRNESANVVELLRRLVPVLPPGSEVLFVDDSDDDTVAVAEAAAVGLPVAVRVHHREPDDRGDGLGGAVRAGLRQANRDWCVVMDADLQHPPELVPDLVRAGEESGSQLVVASRYGGEGDASSFSRGRAAMSTWATRLTKAFFPRRLADVSDPMSGFFAVRRSAIDLDALRPNGFKILLEIAVRCGPLRTVEVPFQFGQRYAGESKASLAECRRLVALLARLWFDAATSRRWARMLAFAVVGASGLVINTLALWVVAGIGGIHYVWGTLLATLVSTTWNWALLEMLVYPGGRGRSALRRLGAFGAVNVLALVLRVPLMALLIERLHVNYLVANIASLLVLFALRFVVSDVIIFRRPTMTTTVNRPTETATPGAREPLLDAPVVEEQPAAPSTAAAESAPEPEVVAAAVTTTPPVVKAAERYFQYRYVVPGVATIGSQVRLPELEWFLTPFVTRGPYDIEIQVARVGHVRGHVRLTADGDVQRTYEEHLGSLGANFSIEMGDTIRVTASPLLLHSPHVLYTNVVEALLRFLAVSKGRVLLHSACVQMNGTGVMLSARTDTGKTGTILRLLREEGARFLSDDMTIVEPSGRAHAFPKPLTISHHTLLAVDSRGLSRAEWRRLRIQSRLHSKEGRLFGMKLAQMNLPIMAFNALTQAVVPPPKYDVDRLVPCDVIHEVDVTDLFIIERGENSTSDIDRDQALDELIDNTDDAYGFPPFSTLAPTLRVAGMDYEELRRRERELLDRALERITVRRLSRDDFGWPAAITAVLSSRPEPKRPQVTRTRELTVRRRRRLLRRDAASAAYAGGQSA
jgi:dolichol-phosphate mannosyltransferase